MGVLLYYVWREERDERAHKEASDWRTPDEHGVTPFIDKYGDLIGPIFNALAWHAALLVTMIR